MAQGEKTREAVLEQVSAARRASLFRVSLQAERRGHYTEALDGYQYIVERYPGSEEAVKVKARLLALAKLFEHRGQPFRSQDARALSVVEGGREPGAYELQRPQHYELHRTGGSGELQRRRYYPKHYRRHG